MNFEDMTPAELKEPVNGYQMLAVVKELKTLNTTLGVVAKQTQSVVTPDVLAKSEEDMKKHVEERIKGEVERIHLKYRPMQKEHEWVKYSLFGGLILQIAFGALLYSLTKD